MRSFAITKRRQLPDHVEDRIQTLNGTALDRYALAQRDGFPVDPPDRTARSIFRRALHPAEMRSLGVRPGRAPAGRGGAAGLRGRQVDRLAKFASAMPQRRSGVVIIREIRQDRRQSCGGGIVLGHEPGFYGFALMGSRGYVDVECLALLDLKSFGVGGLKLADRVIGDLNLGASKHSVSLGGDDAGRIEGFARGGAVRSGGGDPGLSRGSGGFASLDLDRNLARSERGS
ncbi:hypothetical protein LOK46_06790 [Methylobacterium sp. NMS14P]|uniref:hypothetical protein n=1 Tax=Methylobacterium sp. NMS14P TaxID=2894310 RepID=UPI002359868A|nr:hypothetical protein [Methylobacterium sp. NMS14P]WCS26537.1 hypothetical protein LOK46_06790 [Methylobacterium sp. NMS14P]